MTSIELTIDIRDINKYLKFPLRLRVAHRDMLDQCNKQFAIGKSNAKRGFNVGMG